MKDLTENGVSYYTGGKVYTIPSPIEMASICPEDLRELQSGDVIIDRFGKGRTVYVHHCDLCHKVLLMPTVALTPIYCASCANEIMEKEDEKS